MSNYARIVEGFAVEVWDDGGLGITPADVFVPMLAGQFELVPVEIRAGWSLANGVWTAPVPAPEPPPDWPALIAERRYRAETAGIAMDGYRVDTSRDSQSLITGAALQATLDAAYTCRWKTQAGFVDLSATQILALATAVRAHVQACFDREAVLLGEVAAGTFTADLLEQGWPQ
jgi:hypothetical protein